MSEPFLTPRQFAFLLIGFLVGSAILLVPGALIASAGSDAWLTVFMGSLGGMVIMLTISSLQLRFPGLDIVQYSPLILGQTLGKMVGLMYIWFPFHLGALVIRNFGDFMTIEVMPETPMVVFNIAITLTAAAAVYMGIEVLGRVSELFIPPVIIFVVISILLVVPDLDLNNLRPVLGNGWLPLLPPAFSVFSFPFGETVIFAALSPHVKDVKVIRKASLFTLIVATFLGSLIVIITLGILGPVLGGYFVFAPYVVTKYIWVGNFVERIESLVMIVYIIAGFFKISVCYFAVVQGLKHWTGIKDYRPLVWPVGTLMVLLSIISYPNIMEEAFFATKIWPWYALPFELIFPTALWLISLLQGLKGKTAPVLTKPFE